MIKPIVLYPDPRLRKKSQPVTAFDDALKALVSDMVDSMRKAEGIGLSAVQIGDLKRVMTMDVRYDQEDRGEPLVMVNPEITGLSGKDESEEGCLSFPEVREVIERALKVQVRSRDAAGGEQEHEFEGILARCVQHEVDHMNGKLFVERIPAVKRILLKTKLKELERRYKTAAALSPPRLQGPKN